MELKGYSLTYKQQAATIKQLSEDNERLMRERDILYGSALCYMSQSKIDEMLKESGGE